MSAVGPAAPPVRSLPLVGWNRPFVSFSHNLPFAYVFEGNLMVCLRPGAVIGFAS